MWNICCGTFGSARDDPVIQDQHKKRLRAVIKMFFVMGLIRIVEIIRFIFDIMYGNTNLTIRRLSLFFDIMIALQVCTDGSKILHTLFVKHYNDLLDIPSSKLGKYEVIHFYNVDVFCIHLGTK